jgi:hypothetical protein
LPGEGFHDVLVGIGPSGSVVDLHTTSQQTFLVGTAVRLRLTLSHAGTIENSF